MNNITLKEIADLLEEWDNILIITHAHPDGDTLGSAFGLKFAYPNKNIKVICEDNAPANLQFILHDEDLNIPTDLSGYEHIISVDCADMELTGKSINEKFGDKIELKIDHHMPRFDFGKYNYSDTTASGCAEIIFDIIKVHNHLNTKAGICIYAGIATDTGRFMHSNVTAKTMQIVGELITLGVDYYKANTIVFANKTVKEVEALKIAYNNLTFHCNGRIAITTISNREKEEHGLCADDIAIINNIPRDIEGVDLGIVLKEKAEMPGEFKISMRSSETVDCRKICEVFGGGGHIRAAGASVTGCGMKSATQKVLEVAKENLLYGE